MPATIPVLGKSGRVIAFKRENKYNERSKVCLGELEIQYVYKVDHQTILVMWEMV
ncbi:hypothetical protein K8S19_12545 [bacterium]|nr:hypothetical protein [bacterium]